MQLPFQKNIIAIRNLNCDFKFIDDFIKPSKQFDFVTGIQFLVTAPFDPYEFITKTLPYAKKGIFLTSLFNNSFIETDAIITDINGTYNYTHYSLKKLNNWCLKNKLEIYNREYIIPFDIEKKDEDIMQTYTLKKHNKERIQISGNILMHWFEVFIKV